MSSHRPSVLGVYPGAFNPPTIAHLALIRSAAPEVDQVVAVLPRTFPHKEYDGVSLEHRVAMLEAARCEADFSVYITEGGLFIDIARECREVHGSHTEIWFICGRDAAQRIIEWDYGHPNAIHHMLDEFGLLVAARQGDYTPPAALAHRIRPLAVPAEVSRLSATEVRTRIRLGEPWEHLVPASVVPLARSLYT